MYLHTWGCLLARPFASIFKPGGHSSLACDGGPRSPCQTYANERVHNGGPQLHTVGRRQRTRRPTPFICNPVILAQRYVMFTPALAPAKEPLGPSSSTLADPLLAAFSLYKQMSRWLAGWLLEEQRTECPQNPVAKVLRGLTRENLNSPSMALEPLLGPK